MTLKETIIHLLSRNEIDENAIIDLSFTDEQVARSDVKSILSGIPKISNLGAEMGYSENDEVIEYRKIAENAFSILVKSKS